MSIDITQKFLAFTLIGGQWVLWLLIVLSVLSVAVMIERALYILRRRVDFDALARDVRAALHGAPEGLASALRSYESSGAIEVAVARVGLSESPRGAAATAEAMVTARARQRQALERNVAFLGTLGNNAPFIGLFGTVLGIIKAFHDLSKNSQAGAEAVMSGVSEALVATAVGLMVAIPAVMAYNFFSRRIRGAVSNSDAIAHVILTELRADETKAARDKEAA